VHGLLSRASGNGATTSSGHFAQLARSASRHTRDTEWVSPRWKNGPLRGRKAESGAILPLVRRGQKPAAVNRAGTAVAADRLAAAAVFPLGFVHRQSDVASRERRGVSKATWRLEGDACDHSICHASQRCLSEVAVDARVAIQRRRLDFIARRKIGANHTPRRVCECMSGSAWMDDEVLRSSLVWVTSRVERFSEK